MGFFDERREDPASSQNDNNEDPYAYMKQNRTSSILVFVLIIAAYLIYSLFGNSASCSGETTTGRVKLDTDNTTLLSTWYSHESDYTDSSVTDAMISFYEATGIQPFVLLEEDSPMSMEELDKAAEEYYKNDLFADQTYDENHMVIAFQPSDGLVGIYPGTNAQSVMDADATGKLRTIISNCYTKYTGTKILEKSFRQAITDIMGRSKMTIYIIIILAVICVLYFIYNYARAVKRRQKEQNGNGGFNS